MSLLRRAILTAARTPRTFNRVATAPRLSRSAPLFFRPQRAGFSAAAGLSKEDVQARIVDVLKTFEKVPQDKVSALI